MNSKEARGYVHLAGCECQGTTRKALDIVLSDSEKLERIRRVVDDYVLEAWELLEMIKEILKEE